MAERLTTTTARALARRLVDRRARTVLVDGPSGSGKSTFAQDLLGQLRAVPGAPDSVLVRMDDLYPGWSGLERAVDDVARRLVRPHALHGGGRWRPWNWASGTSGGPVQVRERLLLVEGCGTASTASRAVADLTLWIETDDVERRRRALRRDGALFEAHWDEWDEQFRRYRERERPHEGADLILDSSG
ncbi:ATP-binding protein [Rathayibacter sp. SD072]|uniref:ATP-binding protein n=1 Tax=Rathayibacter sp. SD072 TaxID=2781731 RepID=UPI001A959FD6|nr:ATP-binding protein [Rathayibacter sp. SD072]